MGDVPQLRRNIKEEEIRYRSAVSESTFYKIGGAVNFINTYQYFQFYFGMVGPYSFLTVPFNGVGTVEVFDYDAEIVNIIVYNGTAGSSGSTQIDIKKAPLNSSSYSTIFTTKPAVDSTAASGVVFDMNGNMTTPAGCTQPVLITPNFNAGDKLRMDVDSVMGGDPRDLQIQIYWRPR